MTNNVIKYLKSLKQSKQRQKYNNFIVEGKKSVDMLLSQNVFEVECIVVRKKAENEPRDLDIADYKYYEVSEKIMSQISLLKTPSDALAVVKRKRFEFDPTMKTFFYLDNVQDPGNVGTITRIADWFGIDGVIRTKDTASFYNPKVIQSTMGSFMNVNLMDADQILLDNISDFTWYGADMRGEDISSVRFADKSVIVLGNEGKGLSEESRKKIQNFISIEGSEERMAESLNVAIAASIIAYRMTL